MQRQPLQVCGANLQVAESIAGTQHERFERRRTGEKLSERRIVQLGVSQTQRPEAGQANRLRRIDIEISDGQTG